MKLKTLTDSLTECHIYGSTEKDIKNIVYHSDKVTPESLFFAVNGQLDDGKKYIKKAIEKGANTIVLSDLEEKSLPTEITAIKTTDVRKAMAAVSAEFYNNPSQRLLVIGVTGTKGKTSVTFMIRSILEAAGIKTGIIGTVFNGYEGNMAEASATTPQSPDIQRLMAEMEKGGCRAVVMEVSSQGLMHSRVDNIDFDIGVFTNISPDHIGDGEHSCFEEYLFWKKSFFSKCKRAVINCDDSRHEYMIKDSNLEQVVYFGENEKADFRSFNHGLIAEEGNPGITYDLKSKRPCGDDSVRHMVINLAGRFNIQNTLAAIAVSKSLGIPWSIIEETIRNVKIPGRVEKVNISDDFTVLVDYAHNGIALRSLLESLREYNPNRIMLVFGCGGNRDRNRRFEMAEAALKNADFIIVTSDNPRRESPYRIIDDITSKMKFCDKVILAIPDRLKAIQRAVAEAKKGDIIVIAGKGHETYQLIGDETRKFDDKEVILSCKRGLK